MSKLVSLVVAAVLLVACRPAAGGMENKQLNKNKNMEVVHLTKEEFLKQVADYENNPTEWKYLGDKPAIVDFYADWCAPCKMLAPVLEELAAEYKDRIVIYKVNTEQEQELAAVFGIRSIPTLLFVPRQGGPQMAAGALPKNTLKEAIENVLLSNANAE